MINNQVSVDVKMILIVYLIFFISYVTLASITSRLSYTDKDADRW